MNPIHDQRQRLYWLLVFRGILVTTLLASTVLVHLTTRGAEEVAAILPLYAIVAGAYLGNLVYALMFRRQVDYTVQVVVQLVGDLLLAATVVYLTGVILSAFTFMFILATIYGAILLYRRGAVIFSSLATIIYTALLALQLYDVIRPPGVRFADLPAPGGFITNAFAHLLGFNLSAILTSFLAEQARDAKVGLNQLQEIHRQVLQNLPVGVITVDSGDQVAIINSIAQRLLRSGADRPLGFHIRELALPPVARDGDCIFPLEDPVQGRRDVRIQQTPLRVEAGQTLGRIITLEDVTEVREMEHQLSLHQRMASLGELAAGIAHEIRNPLASIRGSVEMLANRTPRDSSERMLMDIMVREIERLNQLVTDFLTYARPTPPNLTLVPFGELLSETIRLLKGSYGDSSVVVTRELPADEVHVSLDPAQFRQVLWNILVNAVDACQGREEPCITCLVTVRAKHLSLTIADNGCGIPEEHQDQIFTPFYTTKDSGSGLGLALVHRIIMNHGGTIAVDSTVGKGTAVVIEIPFT